MPRVCWECKALNQITVDLVSVTPVAGAGVGAWLGSASGVPGVGARRGPMNQDGGGDPGGRRRGDGNGERPKRRRRASIVDGL